MTTQKQQRSPIVRKARAVARNMRDAVRPPADHFKGPVYFIVSPYKTGSTTVGNALTTLGAGRAEMAFYPKLARKFRPVVNALNNAVPTDIPADEYIETHQEVIRSALAELTRKSAAYDVFADLPLGHGNVHPFVLRALAPEGRFIWINRDMNDWLASVRNWEETHPNAYPGHKDWTTRPRVKRRALRALWHQRRRRFRRLARVFPADCLELHINELSNWDALAAFTGCQKPDTPLQALNVSKTPRS